MQLKNTGKTITKVKERKGNFLIYFGRESIEISEDAYLLKHIYVGKELTSKDIKDLLEVSKISVYLNKALNLISKKFYTEQEMRNKLSSYGLDNKSINQIIKGLKRNDLINDDAFIEDHLGWAEERCVGKYKILKELKQKGIDDKKLSRIKFDKQNETFKALQNLAKLESKYEDLSYESKKQHIYRSLIGLGFESDIVESIVKQISKNEEAELESLDEAYQNLLTRLETKYSGETLKNKLTLKLINKGYRYEDIQRIMEENDYDDWRIC